MRVSWLLSPLLCLRAYREVDCLLCDLDVLCRQNTRFLAAGMLDAIAKHVEISHHETIQGEVGQDVLLARQLAKTIYDDMMLLGPNALQRETRAMERCIFHAIITTGLVSGIARGRYQSALAHALYEAIRTCYTAESRPFLHGEVVAVGLLVQSRYLHRADAAARDGIFPCFQVLANVLSAHGLL